MTAFTGVRLLASSRAQEHVARVLVPFRVEYLRPLILAEDVVRHLGYVSDETVRAPCKRLSVDNGEEPCRGGIGQARRAECDRDVGNRVEIACDTVRRGVMSDYDPSAV